MLLRLERIADWSRPLVRRPLARTAMTLYWPDEDCTIRDRVGREMREFLARYRALPRRAEAGSILAQMTNRRPDPEGAARVLEADHPDIAARIRAEADEQWYRTMDGLLAEASIAEAPSLPPAAAARLLGTVGGVLVADHFISEALADEALRQHVVRGLCEAFA